MQKLIDQPPDGIEDRLWSTMPSDARSAILSAEALLSLDEPKFDYGLAIVGYFKAIEIVLDERVFNPFREYTRSAGKAEEALQNIENGQILPGVNLEYHDHGQKLRHYVFREKPLTLVDMAQILQTLKRVGDHKKYGILWPFKKFVRRQYTEGYRFWSVNRRLAIKLESAVIAERNPAAHTQICSRKQALAVQTRMFGDQSQEGILISVLKALVKEQDNVL